MHSFSWIGALLLTALVTLGWLSSCETLLAPAATVSFKPKLSDYGIYADTVARFVPAAGVAQYELAAELYTDYTDTQRLVLLPAGEQMHVQGDGLPVFPEGTLLAKTFAYTPAATTTSSALRAIETRLLIKHESVWNAATYQWDDQQADALLTTAGAEVPIEFVGPNGMAMQTTYQTPAQTECASCHAQDNHLSPLGPKAINLDRSVVREGRTVSQLDYLQAQKVIVYAAQHVQAMSAYNDVEQSLAARARSYLDLNCAQCHNPAGSGYYLGMDLRYTTAFAETGIDSRGAQITGRMSGAGELHMP